MSGKLKSLLAVLAAGAGFSFWYMTGATVPGPQDIGTAQIAAQRTPVAACKDADNDGLCDFDELYWSSDPMVQDTDGDGFLDGEEVLSGHDPTKAGPNDYLDEKRNLTERMASLLLGAASSGALDETSPGYEESIAALVDEMFTQYDANVAVELDSIALSSGSAVELASYGLRMTNILTPMFKEISANYKGLLAAVEDVPFEEMPDMKQKYPEAFTAFTKAADAETAAFGDRVRAVRSVGVPRQMEKFHRSLLLYLRGTQQRYKTLTAIDRDPLTGLISLQVIQTLAFSTPLELLEKFDDDLTDAINRLL